MKKLNELREMSIENLQEELLNLRKKQFNLRLKKANGSLEKNHIVKIVRRSIAQIKTLMSEARGARNGD